MNRILFSSASEHWRTPVALYKSLHEEFRFDFDPCPIGGTGGLDISWEGKRVYCNPPYGPGIGDWLSKAKEAYLAVFLVPARTDTRWFHNLVIPTAKEIRFLKGRLHFNEKGPAPFPSMLAIFHD